MSRRRIRTMGAEKAQGHRNFINWLKRDNSPAPQDVADRLAGCRVGTFEKVFLPIYTTDDEVDYIGSTVPCDKHLCDFCGVEKAFNLRQRYLPLVETNWPFGQHIHFIPTIRHKPEDPWIDLISVLMFIWKKLYRLSWWKKAVIGFIRNDETRHYKNGFHVHQHNIITLRPEIDIIRFSDKIKNHYTNNAAKLGYLIDWSSDLGWWKKIEDKPGLYRAINYATKGIVWREFDDGVGPRAQSGAHAFAEVWNSSFKHRWHSSSGVWKGRIPSETAPTPSRNPSMGITTRKWNGMDSATRDAVRSCIGAPGGVESMQKLLGDDGSLFRLPSSPEANGSAGSSGLGESGP